MRKNRVDNKKPRQFREKSSYESGQRPAPVSGSHGPYANKDVRCRAWGDRVDMSVCITRSTRHPEKCSGCPCNL